MSGDPVLHSQACVDACVEELFVDVRHRRVERPHVGPWGMAVPPVALVALVTMYMIGGAVSSGPDIAWIFGSLALVVVVAAGAASRGGSLRSLTPLAAAALLALAVGPALGGWAMGRDVAMLLGSIVAGAVAARSVARVAWVFPIGVAIAWSDLQSFLNGSTHAMLDGLSSGGPTQAGGVLHSVGAVPFVQLPAHEGVWLVGCVDIFMIAVLLGAATNHRLGLVRSVLALICGIALALVVGPPVPLLPFLALAFSLVHTRILARGIRYGVARTIRPIG